MSLESDIDGVLREWSAAGYRPTMILASKQEKAALGATYRGLPVVLADAPAPGWEVVTSAPWDT